MGPGWTEAVQRWLADASLKDGKPCQHLPGATLQPKAAATQLSILSGTLLDLLKTLCAWLRGICMPSVESTVAGCIHGYSSMLGQEQPRFTSGCAVTVYTGLASLGSGQPCSVT